AHPTTSAMRVPTLAPSPKALEAANFCVARAERARLHCGVLHVPGSAAAPTFSESEPAHPGIDPSVRVSSVAWHVTCAISTKSTARFTKTSAGLQAASDR